MKYIVNFKDKRTGEILDRKVDGLEFSTEKEAIDFANEYYQVYTLVFLENFDVKDDISPHSKEYFVEKIVE